MEFRVLGPLEVQVGSDIVRLPGTNTRALLARLLVDAGRVVSVDVLADALWESAPPANVANSIQANVSKLRSALERHASAGIGPATIVTQGRGYVVRLDGHSFDVHRAGELLVSARDALREAAPQRAVDLASEVVALYRGEPYADVAYQGWIQPEVHRLNELRMEATEVLYAARLELGHHGELIAALESLVAAHPLRERLRGLLMLALYRAGRQADALRCFSAGRVALVDELGIEPGPELRELERRILEQDRTLDARIEPVRAVVASGVIGRARERQELTAALRAATTGGTHVVLVHGEPGIGKTALANWLITEADAAGAIVGHGRAPAIGGAPPFWPWTEALRSIVEARPALLSKLTRSDVDVLARLVPRLAEGASPASSGQPSAFMFDSVSRLLVAASTDDPLVLVLDDLHWADEGSLDLFNFVATSRSRSRILLVGLARPDVEPQHPLRVHLASLVSQPRVAHLGLTGLDLDEVVELVTDVTGSRPDEHLAEVLRDRTGGNPFFIREVLRVATDEQGKFDPSLVAVPDSVREVIRGRVARLGPDATAVFTVLSFARDAFTTVLPDHLVDVGPDGVTDVIEAALSAGLLIDVPGRPGFYRFAHSLVRHVFYDGLPAARRAETHLRVARVLEDVAPRPMEIANELAWHYSHAATVGGAAEAVRWERIAAEKACRSFAYQDAVHHLRRALASVRKVLRDDELEYEVLSELVAVAHQGGDAETASAAERRMATLR